MSIWEFANPVKFMRLSEKLIPGLMILCVLTLVPGVIWGFFFTPEAVNFGQSVKIIYVHVPSAMMAINIWVMMLVASLVWVIRRHHVSARAAKSAGLIGLVMTLIALITGALWGQPMWGSYWAWDPRLTSFLILLLFYFGYLALWEVIENPETASDLTAILCMVGSVFALLSRYAVNFWNQGLHQGASLSLDKEKHVADVYYAPLLLTIAGFVLLFVTLLLIRTRSELRMVRLQRIEAQERMSDD